MSRTLVTTLLLTLLAAPMALAQHGPPPGYTDPNEYAQDYAQQQVDEASADPVGYAQGADAGAEAEHALWLACWEAYEATGHALDAACAPFFTAPVTVEPDVAAVQAEVTQVLNDTGVSDLAAEALDIVNDTVADPASALDQVQRAADAVVRFVKDLVDFAKDLVGFLLDALGLGALAVAAGVLGAAQGLLDLASLPLDGLRLAGQGLADVAGAVASILGLAGSGLATASSTVGGAVLDAASATVQAVEAAASGLSDAAGAAAQGVADGAQAVADTVGDAADAVRDTVADTLEKVGSLFDGKERSAADRSGIPQTPRTGTDADGLIDGLLNEL